MRPYSLKKIGRAGPKILLLHGLYSNAGAWIPVLPYFKKFQLTLITIDYHKVLLTDAMTDLVSDISSNLTDIYDLAIGHSFGAFLLSVLKTESLAKIYIAPPFVALNFLFEEYLNFICASTTYDPIEVSEVIKQAILMNERLELKFGATDIVLLPSLDEFFLYSDGISPYANFCGNHSDIKSAIDFVFSERIIAC